MSLFNFFSNPSVSVTEAASELSKGGATLVDVRTPAEFRGGHATGAVNCPLPALAGCIDKLKKVPTVYVICQSGGRSAAATSMLLRENINAINVTGGTSAWRASGLPIS